MNASKELKPVLFSSEREIKCAKVLDIFGGYTMDIFQLRVGYTAEEKRKFLKKLDFEYDLYYGDPGHVLCRVLSGTIWFTDGTWLERRTNEEGQWWSHQCVPRIPEDLL